MNSHELARLTPNGRALLVSRVLDEGRTVADASMAAGVSKRTSYKWPARFKAEGELGLRDRSSHPRHCPRGLSAEKQGSLEALRRQRWPLWRFAMQAGLGQPVHDAHVEHLQALLVREALLARIDAADADLAHPLGLDRRRRAADLVRHMPAQAGGA